MENLDLKQMSAMVDIIAEEKGLPKETVLNVIEQAIAAAWRKDNGESRHVRAKEGKEGKIEEDEDGVLYENEDGGGDGVFNLGHVSRDAGNDVSFTLL